MSPINRNILGLRINNRLVGYATLAGAALAAPAIADASIVYSGPVSIVIPNTADGLYLNVVNGATGTTTGPAGWDINPYSSAPATPNFTLWGPTANTWFNSNGVINPPGYNLAFGTSISGAATAFFRPGGSLDVGPEIHLNSSNNYLGFRFVNEALGNQVQFGWVQIQFGATLADRTIIGYAYENTGAAIGAGVFVPEPSTMALFSVMAAGALGVRAWRKRKAA
jgi:hypothetical protein